MLTRQAKRVVTGNVMKAFHFSFSTQPIRMSVLKPLFHSSQNPARCENFHPITIFESTRYELAFAMSGNEALRAQKPESHDKLMKLMRFIRRPQGELQFRSDIHELFSDNSFLKKRGDGRVLFNASFSNKLLYIKRRFFRMSRDTRSKLTGTHHLVMKKYSNFLAFHTFLSRQTNLKSTSNVLSLKQS